MKIKRIIAENYKTYKALGLNLESMAMPQAVPTATERSEVCYRSGACSLGP